MKIRSLLVFFLLVATSCTALDRKSVEIERNRIRMLSLMTCLESSNGKYVDIFKVDASAGAVVELGKYSDDVVYSTVDSLAKDAAKKVMSGKYGGTLDMMKCWDFVGSASFDSVVRGFDRYLPR